MRNMSSIYWNVKFIINESGRAFSLLFYSSKLFGNVMRIKFPMGSFQER